MSGVLVRRPPCVFSKNLGASLKYKYRCAFSICHLLASNLLQKLFCERRVSLEVLRYSTRTTLCTYSVHDGLALLVGNISAMPKPTPSRPSRLSAHVVGLPSQGQRVRCNSCSPSRSTRTWTQEVFLDALPLQVFEAVSTTARRRWDNARHRSR
ncbi:hypothetical protein BDW02DRAFT_195919 [Decorospora gaudefroyi]|uniref:Uncharacterized protein n=1 Tax=Decorospora gaudefroyi TaxID=184978 RepID=A0A6A5KTI4_9PLEO|nr:hypothetical protein BDW02DRAFT_195919 [Decorospora gaudefroyi]